MTLCVSLRVPDGVIAAVDSLATAIETIQIKAEVKGACPHCGKDIELHDVGLPNISRPAATSETALKMQSLTSQCAATHFGIEYLNGKSVYRQLKGFNRRESERVKTCKEAAEALLGYLDGEFRAEGHDMASLPDEAFILGVQVSGYDNSDELAGHTYVVRIGKVSRIDHYTDAGCTISGDREVVIKLWEEGKEGLSVPRPSWSGLSVQDAIDYADFLIRTTADYQRFAPVLPTVGGPVDIALVTQYGGFRWIRRKELVKLLEEER